MLDFLEGAGSRRETKRVVREMVVLMVGA